MSRLICMMFVADLIARGLDLFRVLWHVDQSLRGCGMGVPCVACHAQSVAATNRATEQL
jgi:hypothetical protein